VHGKDEKEIKEKIEGKNNNKRKKAGLEIGLDIYG